MSHLTEAVIRIQEKEGGHLYLLVDAARNPMVVVKLLQTGHLLIPIFHRQPIPPVLLKAVPYLARCEPDGELLQWFEKEGWGNAWGILMLSSASTPRMYEHLCKLMQVQLEDGKRMLFRYWDPRVLREFLPTCNDDQILALYGPIQRFILEDGDAKIVQFTP